MRSTCGKCNFAVAPKFCLFYSAVTYPGLPAARVLSQAKSPSHLIYDQFFKYLNDNDLLVNCQSGFRSLHSTLMSLIEASNSWSVNIDNGLINGVIFIDLKKAFDTINHKILLRKLTSYGIDHRALKWFDSYLSDRQQKCVIIIIKVFIKNSLRKQTCDV